MFLQTATSTPSPIPGVAFILAVCGSIVDWRYKRNGGKKPSKRDRLLFLAAFAILAVLLITFWVLGGGSRGAAPEIIGYTGVPFIVLLFGTWELGRWRVRRKNPLPKSGTSVEIQAAVATSPSPVMLQPLRVESDQRAASAAHKIVKVEYNGNIRRIPATDVRVENGQLRIYDGDKLVGEFSQSRVDNWSFETD
jgi:hypothetical protein